MAFKTLEPANAGGSGARHPLTVSSLSAGTAGYCLRLSFSKEITSKLSWSNGDRITVGVGKGSDAGWLRLKNGNLSGYKLRAAAPKNSRSFLTIATIGDRKKHTAKPAEHKIRSGAVFVKLPDWALSQ